MHKIKFCFNELFENISNDFLVVEFFWGFKLFLPLLHELLFCCFKLPFLSNGESLFRFHLKQSLEGTVFIATCIAKRVLFIISSVLQWLVRPVLFVSLDNCFHVIVRAFYFSHIEYRMNSESEWIGTFLALKTNSIVNRPHILNQSLKFSVALEHLLDVVVFYLFLLKQVLIKLHLPFTVWFYFLDLFFPYLCIFSIFIYK